MTLGEYLQIREARLALLCVGEDIFYLHSFATDHNALRKYPIGEINEQGIIIHNLGYAAECSFDTIEYHQGDLYIWKAPPPYCDYTRMGKVDAMIQLIESDEIKLTEYNILRPL